MRNDTCAAEDCDEPTPWDMASVKLDDLAYCSPECAKSALSDMSTAPTMVTLHDPQYVSDRSTVGVDEGSVDIERDVTDVDDAKDAIETAADLYSAPFRVQID